MQPCPACDHKLTVKSTPHGRVHLCENCRGRSILIPVLRKAGARPAVIRRIWQEASEGGAGGHRECPHCGRTMAHVEAQVGGETLPLDVCSLCMAVWFDESELEPVLDGALASSGGHNDDEMPVRARKQAALMKMKTREEQNSSRGAASSMPDEGWHWLPGLLGLPVETKAPTVDDRPWGTWTFAAACVVFTALAVGLAGMREAVDAFGFIPAQWYRYGGLTLLTSFFLHGGVMHLLGNTYFLYVFGDNVEDRLGTPQFILLLFAGHLAGMLAQGLGTPHPSVPTLGASAGISAVVAFYGIMFPRARLSFALWLYWRPYWIKMRAPWALGLYVAYQLFGLYLQLSGFGGVSYLGHVGGLAVGGAAALWCWQMERQRQAEEWERVAT